MSHVHKLFFFFICPKIQELHKPAYKFSKELTSNGRLRIGYVFSESAVRTHYFATEIISFLKLAIFRTTHAKR